MEAAQEDPHAGLPLHVLHLWFHLGLPGVLPLLVPAGQPGASVVYSGYEALVSIDSIPRNSILFLPHSYLILSGWNVVKVHTDHWQENARGGEGKYRPNSPPW